MLLDLDGSWGPALFACSPELDRTIFRGAVAPSSVVMLVSVKSATPIAASASSRLVTSIYCAFLASPLTVMTPPGPGIFSMSVEVDGHEFYKGRATQKSVVDSFKGYHLKEKCISPKVI